MLILAILATGASIVITLFVALANGMSSTPNAPFRGIGIIIVAWLVTAALWLAVALS